MCSRYVKGMLTIEKYAEQDQLMIKKKIITTIKMGMQKSATVQLLCIFNIIYLYDDCEGLMIGDIFGKHYCGLYTIFSGVFLSNSLKDGNQLLKAVYPYECTLP